MNEPRSPRGREAFRTHFEGNARAGDGVRAVDYASDRSYALRARVVTDWVGHLEGRRVLDIGCGQGLMTRFLTDRNRVVGIDFAAPMLEAARGRELRVALADAERIPVASASMDLILAVEVAQYLEDLVPLVCEARRISRPGGRFLISTLSASWARRARAGLRSPGPTNPYLHAVSGARAALMAHGFEIERCRHWFLPMGWHSDSRWGDLIGGALGSAFALLARVPDVARSR